MAPSATQPDNASLDVQDLFHWLRKNQISCTNNSSATPFVPYSKLRDYLIADQRTEKLLRAQFPDRGYHWCSNLAPTIQADFLRVFTILICIGKGSYIESFLQHINLRDRKLPFLSATALSGPANFPEDPNDPQFWNSFFSKQFTFCAHSLTYNENYVQLEDRFVLPITSKEKIDQGGSAILYKIQVHPEYDKLLPPSELATRRNFGGRPSNTYVLKTYNTRDARKYFDAEVDAFRKLATKNPDDRSLILFLGSYRQGDTHNILLEYADGGNLEEYFQQIPSPSLPRDVLMFWGGLFNIFKALKRIHEAERDKGFKGPDILIGWHQDVKPKNILILSGKTTNPYDVEFKLADLGLSHFKRVEKSGKLVTDCDVGGTKDYGAPECHRSGTFLENSRINVDSSVDIWSFGCVCSEAAVWVVHTALGLNNYRTQRQEEIASKDEQLEGCCFHDGENVLQAVTDMHTSLPKEGAIRTADYVTKPVLEILLPSMLETQPRDREKANSLWKKCERILEAADKKIKGGNLQPNPANANTTINRAQTTALVAPQIQSYHPSERPQPSHMGFNPHGTPPSLPQYRSNSSAQMHSQEALRRSSGTRRGRDIQLESPPESPYEELTPLAESGRAFTTSPPRHTIGSPPDRLTSYVTTRRETSPGLGSDGKNNARASRQSLPNQSFGMSSIGGEFPQRLSRNPSARRPQPTVGARLPDLEPGEANFEPLPSPSQGMYTSAAGSSPVILDESNVVNGYEHHKTSSGSSETNQKIPIHDQSSPPLGYTPAAELPVPEQKPSKPFLSFQDAKRIRERREALPDDQQWLLNDLTNRDHVFLIDDSISMKEHWPDVISFFSVFAYFAKKLDDNGLEMSFTVARDPVKFRNTKTAVEHLRAVQHRASPNMDLRLGDLLGKYKEDLKRQDERKHSFWSKAYKPVKPLSLYVLTDGTWPNCNAVRPIEDMILFGRPKEQVGIQFVRFGNRPIGIKRLKYLDSGLRKKHGRDRDIVDTEPFQDGNVLKMFLGAISHHFDDDDDDEDIDITPPP